MAIRLSIENISPEYKDKKIFTDTNADNAIARITIKTADLPSVVDTLPYLPTRLRRPASNVVPLSELFEPWAGFQPKKRDRSLSPYAIDVSVLLRESGILLTSITSEEKVKPTHHFGLGEIGTWDPESLRYILPAFFYDQERRYWGELIIQEKASFATPPHDRVEFVKKHYRDLNPTPRRNP